MLRLRLRDGLDEDALTRRYGVKLAPRQLAFLHSIQREGLVERRQGAWALTGRGLLVENAILGGPFVKVLRLC